MESRRPETVLSGETLFAPEIGGRPVAGCCALATGLPLDVVQQSAERLRVLAILYASVFFLAGVFPALLHAENRAYFFAIPERWVPGLVSIAMGLVVAAIARSPPLSLPTVLKLAAVFQVASSFGIAAAEFLDLAEMGFPSHWVGLSWVAVWSMLFTIVVPSAPRRAAAASLLSMSSVPLVLAWTGALRGTPSLAPQVFFFAFVFPYLLVTGMAYVGARVVYDLGRAVTRARELGGYRLEERLGAGGMGEVWRASHRLLARSAAVKLVRPEVLGAATPDRREVIRRRFEREAQSTASMRSPHTIDLYDFGVAADGTFYYVMELLCGFDLDTLVTRFGPVEPARAVRFLTQVCHSLGEAHEAGLIHRDIKPANVYVCRYGREVDFVKVLDFGLVKSQHDAELGEPELTADNTVGGTPAFMAPEQVLRNREVDGRTDLYAVGCLAYWLVTGELVFRGKNAIETMLLHARETPIPPSMRGAGNIPPGLEKVILECLAKDPDDRPASADALAERLAGLACDCTWSAAKARAWWEENHVPGGERLQLETAP